MLERPEIDKAKSQRNIFLLALVFMIAIAMIAMLVFMNGRITGYHTLNTFETESIVTGSSADRSLSFQQIPNFIAEVGDEVNFKVVPNREDVVFREDTNLFNINQYGEVSFQPEPDDVGKHNVWFIIKDEQGRYYYQNVVIIIED